MIEWRDEGALLKVRKHGETSVIIEVFTATHGRAAGMVPVSYTHLTLPTIYSV